jgi:large subunit ribosomal protein L13
MATIIDTSNAPMGRAASLIAHRLLKGEKIIVINSEKTIISGRKREIKKRYKAKRDIGTYRKGPFAPRTPDRILKRTIRGMLPYQQTKGRKALKNLKTYIGTPAEFQQQNIEILWEKPKPEYYITLEELSKSLKT